jgi:rhomboid family protein
MIPLHDLEATRRVPVVTRLLLLANLAVWVYILGLAGHPAALQAFYDRWSFDPDALRTAVVTGHLTVEALLPIVTHQFIHAGWLHILGNLLYLWIFGDNVEDHMGSGPFLVFYLVAGVVAAIGQAVVAPAPMVGASGAIAGVLGAYFVLSPGARVRTLVFLGIFVTVVTLPAIIVIGEWVVLQVVSGLDSMRIATQRATENVAYVAHVFGFATGVVAVAVFGLGRRAR